MSSIDRQPHKLKREKTLAMPRHVIFYDTETDYFTSPDGVTTHELKLGWTCYYRRGDSTRQEKQEWLEFTEQSSFWSFVLSKCQTKNRLWVISHNLSFDFTVVEGFKHLRQAGFKCKFFYSSGTTTLIKVTKKGFSIIFVDSLNWFKESLKVIGDRIGIPKLEIDFDKADDSLLSTYCKRDVEILVGIFKQMIQFLQDNRISRLCYTIGSTAMAAFLLRHYHDDIYIHNNREAIELERAAYKGGRTECFYLGELTDGPYYVVDVNSLYPYVMRNHSYPVKYKTILHNVRLPEIQNFLLQFAAVARTLVCTDRPVFAVRRDRTIFPVGEFECVMATPELLYAIDNGFIRDIKTVVLYDKAPIFDTYVDRFYKLRQNFKTNDQLLLEHFCKLMLNSLYGKFGQKAELWQKIGNCPDEPDRVEDIIDVVSGRRKKLRYLLGEIFEMTGHDESRHSFPAIAAHVTAYARLYLWQLMEIAGQGNYYYCDTDSLFVNQQGMENLSGLVDRVKLGYLKVDQVTDHIIIYGLKDYVTAAKTVIKGIKKISERIDNVTFTQETWPTLQGLLRDNQADTYQTLRTTKTLKREYVKGDVTDSGRIFPYHLHDLV